MASFSASVQCVGPSAYADATSVPWFAPPTCSCDSENNLVSVEVNMGSSLTQCWSSGSSQWTSVSVPQCVSESSLGWCDDGGGDPFLCYFSRSGHTYCGAFEYDCLGGACVPTGRFLDTSSFGSSAGTYSSPSSLTSTMGWQQFTASTGDVRCCGVTNDAYNSDNRSWDIEDNAWTLFGLTWVVLFATTALTVYHYVTSARAKISQMQRRVARGQIPSRHTVAVAAPPPQQTVVMMPTPPAPATATSTA